MEQQKIKQNDTIVILKESILDFSGETAVKIKSAIMPANHFAFINILPNDNWLQATAKWSVQTVAGNMLPYAFGRLGSSLSWDIANQSNNQTWTQPLLDINIINEIKSNTIAFCGTAAVKLEEIVVPAIAAPQKTIFSWLTVELFKSVTKTFAKVASEASIDYLSEYNNKTDVLLQAKGKIIFNNLQKKTIVDYLGKIATKSEEIIIPVVVANLTQILVPMALSTVIPMPIVNSRIARILLPTAAAFLASNGMTFLKATTKAAINNIVTKTMKKTETNCQAAQ